MRQPSMIQFLAIVLWCGVVVGCERAHELDPSLTAPAESPSDANMDDASVQKGENPFLGSWKLTDGVAEDVEGLDGSARRRFPTLILNFRSDGTSSVQVSDDWEYAFCEEPQSSCSWPGTYTYTATSITLDEESGPEPGEDTMQYAFCGGRLILMDYGVRMTFKRTRRDCYVGDCD